jgi:hypothetical protein
MTTVAMSTAPDNTSATTFRAWGSAISAALAAIGWVKITTGTSINWASVTQPTVANSSKGYEVWRMNDALQSTAPVFMKIEYGSGEAAAYPAVWITYGTAQNGSGTLTGQVSTRKIYVGYNTASACTCYFSGTSSRLTVFLWVENYGPFFVTERTRNNAGAETGTGLMIGGGPTTTAGTDKFSQYVPFTGPIPAMYAAFNTYSPPSGNGTYQTNVFMAPVRTWTPGESNPFVSLATYCAGDIGSGSQITVADWTGTNRNFYVTGLWSTLGAGGTNYMAVLYE